MANATAIKQSVATGLVNAATMTLLTGTVLAFTISAAWATPELGKGQPCSNCHTGSPPTKSNAKK